MGTAIVAAAAAIIGTVVAGVMQHSMHRFNRRDQNRDKSAEALVVFLGSSTEYRALLYMEHTRRVRGAEETLESRWERYEARAAVTKSMVVLRLSISNKDIVRLANTLMTATFQLGNVSDEVLPAARVAAVEAHNALQEAASSFIHAK